jgi:heat shock protein HtpX
MTHIINRDVKVMVIINVFIWMIWTIWYILLRSGSKSRSSSKKWWNPLPLLWLMLYLLSILVLPFIKLAISRRKEYLADAWSVELTSDKLAMISALKKISQDSRIEAIDWQSSNIKSMFISNPWKKASFFLGLFSTHPPIESRIEMLEKY